MAEEDPDANRVVALYDFEPSSVDWPFRRQQPLPLQIGQVIEVLQDDGSLWVLGQLVGNPEMRGYFPKNYTISVTEYTEMMQEYDEEDFDDEGHSESLGQPAARSFSPGPRVEIGVASFPAEFDALSAEPPQATVLEATKARLLAEMPKLHEDAFAIQPLAEGKEERMEARDEMERELRDLAGWGKQSDSRSSTPRTYTQTRPERDFVRRIIPMEIQEHFLQPLAPLKDLLRCKFKLPQQVKIPFDADLRGRSITCRLAAGIEPPHMRMALQSSAANGSRWSQMFSPGFNDMVNDSFRVGCNACILSHFYLRDADAQEQFQRLHIKASNGVLWFELRRKKSHIFYRKIDVVEVMMHHPTAWGFPDCDRRASANPGEPVNSFHGWYAQPPINTDKEMESVDFLYHLRLRFFPNRIFEAMTLGRLPEWMGQPKMQHLKTESEDDTESGGESEHEAVSKDPSPVDLGRNSLLEAGLEEADDLYVKLDQSRVARERSVGPDVLDTETMSFILSGRCAMRIFLRSRGLPDNMRQTQISPKMVKDMAGQLGIRNSPAHYWYCMFVLRYPLAHDWEAVVKNDTRLYLHLPTDTAQLIHPLIKRFRDHLDDCRQNEFLWDYRGFVTMKCSECGVPEAVVWCMQCTDYFCAACFLFSHKSARGHKHYPMPIPGSRYLTEDESNRLKSHLPFLNVGFSNRRRFLARDNQSDKMGSRSGDPWLFFDADTFQEALAQAPQKHWQLKRMHPPRLGPDADGYYYNFERDVIADDASHILAKASEQKAVSSMQRYIRGCLTRKRLKLLLGAALVIEKSKRMWDCQREHGQGGRNIALLKTWYRKYKARVYKYELEAKMRRLQGIYAGHLARKKFASDSAVVTRFQSAYRGVLRRRRADVLKAAVECIQRYFRGYLYGRRPVREMLNSASKIQALGRGVALRELFRARTRAAKYIQARTRGMLCRIYIRKMRIGGLKIQTNWRRFQGQLYMKVLLYDKLQSIQQRRKEILRAKLEDKVAALLQRNFRRHRDYQKFIFRRREKGAADKRTSTMLVALFTAAAGVRHFIHPWWRHLPVEIRDVLRQVKASMQRSIGLVPVVGKLASEELGRRGLRVAHKGNLHYEQDERDPDLASHMLLSVTRHLMTHVPPELFSQTVYWACYSIGHQAVNLNSLRGSFELDDIRVGVDLPPHPGDTLATLWQDYEIIRHHHDHSLCLAEESFPCLILNKLPLQQRQVYLTAAVLISMRQALDNPQISTEDHLKFQGLDAEAGAQMMEVIGSELDHRIPLEWPRTYGTVAGLANALGKHLAELQADKLKNLDATSVVAAKSKAKAKAEPKDTDSVVGGAKKSAPPAPPAAKGKAKAKPGQTGNALLGSDLHKSDEVAARATAAFTLAPPRGGVLSHFNRAATLRVVQQVGYFMSGQENLINSVLGKEPELPESEEGASVRRSRYISVTDKLFEMADRAKHDHCSFVLAVVLYHMVIRGLLLRVLYHRAAIAIQKRFRYLKTKGQKTHMLIPALTIQRIWRGCRTGLHIMRQDDAAFTIQRNWKAWHWNKRACLLMRNTSKIQKVWLGAIYRIWMRLCHKSATVIQKIVRGVLVRVVLNKEGREIQLRYKNRLKDEILRNKRNMPEAVYLAKAGALLGRMTSELNLHRERMIDLRRMYVHASQVVNRGISKERKLKLKGAIQPARRSVFEPTSVALARLEPPHDPMMGLKNSRVLALAFTLRQQLDRALPKKKHFRHHVSAKRGRAAIAARRIAKTPHEELRASATTVVDHSSFKTWAHRQFRV